MSYRLDDYDAAVLERGRGYYEAGRVLRTHRVGNVLAGEVLGSRPQPYHVLVTLTVGGVREEIVSTSCTCPMQQDCKHVAALLYAAKAANSPETAKMSTSPSDWLKAFDNAYPAETAQWPPEPGHHTVFKLQSNEIGGSVRPSLSLTFWRSAWRKSGGWGKMQPQVLRDQSYYRDDSSRLAFDLLLKAFGKEEAVYNYGSENAFRCVEFPVIFDHAAHTEILEAVVNAGHCFWKDREAPIRWGKPRLLKLGWQRESDGGQTLACRVESAVLASVSPAIYLDVDSDAVTIGEVQTSILPRLLPHMLAAPTVPLEEVDAFCRAFPKSLEGAVPPPSTARARSETAKPMPRLRLNLRCDAADDAVISLGANLKFAYGNAEVEPAGRGSTKPVYFEQRGELCVTRRCRETERDAALALKAAGFTLEGEGDRSRCRPKVLANLQDYYAFCATALKELTDIGWEVHGDALPQRAVAIDAPIEADIEAEDASPWFNLHMGIEVEGERVDLTHVIRNALLCPKLGVDPDSLSRSTRELTYLPLDDDRMIAMPTARLQQIMSILQELYAGNPRMGITQAAELQSLAEVGGAKLRGAAFVLELAARLRACGGVPAADRPDCVQAELRGYQLEGLGWLQFLRQYNFAGILADDMGLGKTLQILAHVAVEKQEKRLSKPALVVAPTSLLHNWQQEAARFVPDLDVGLFYGQERYDRVDLFASSDIVLTTYGLLARDIDTLAREEFYLVVLDESQNIKNARGRTHASARRLRCTHRVCLSGTPLQNHLGDLWAQFNFLMPPLLDDSKTFKKTFRDPIEKEQDPIRRAQLQRWTRPFILRRTKAEVIKELPPKIEMIQTAKLQGAQRDLYETVRVAMDTRVRKEINERGISRASIVLLDALLKLRQVCCDPRLVKLQAARRVMQSAKLELLFDLLPSLLEDGRRILVFSQFTSMLDLIGTQLDMAEQPFVRLDGSMSPVIRSRAVQAFQDEQVPLMLLSLKAGGTGLNLTAADTVVHYDPWWNPAAENQATDRAHRLGQSKSVMVYKLIVEGSVEERIVELQKRKTALADALMGDGKLANLLTSEDLDDLFAPLPLHVPTQPGRAVRALT